MKNIIGKFIKSRRSEAAITKMKELGSEVANFAIDKALSKAKVIANSSFSQGKDSALAFSRVVRSNPVATAVIVTTLVVTVFAMQKAVSAAVARA